MVALPDRVVPVDAAAIVFYAWLSPALAIGMLAVCALFLYPIVLLGANTWIAAAIVFVGAWVGQFIGHAIEGRKPSFSEDLKFLLIGPLWLLADLYRRLGIRY
ncbi:MAG TPA: Mpo1-like protein [Casimicrobiaceae bacterium]|nr:Mpo1-like protein [Casimicrobiaceae bacterium]